MSSPAAGPHGYEVRASRRQFGGRVIAVRSDHVAMPGGAEAIRDVVEHPGAVAVLALDEAGAVVLVRQYRHPVRQRLWELPAGLLDIVGEDPVDAAMRELQEEAGLRAGRWDVLADVLTSPGMTDEAIRVYLARDLEHVEQPEGFDEEADMTVERLPLNEAADLVLAGHIRNGAACVGILAAVVSQVQGFDGLRPARSEWPDRSDR
jgi:8-oxo-dGTP pyrophosphatase MutT (NUDIX family)